MVRVGVLGRRSRRVVVVGGLYKGGGSSVTRWVGAGMAIVRT